MCLVLDDPEPVLVAAAVLRLEGGWPRGDGVEDGACCCLGVGEHPEDRADVHLRLAEQTEAVFLGAGKGGLVRPDDAVLVRVDAHPREEDAARIRRAVDEEPLLVSVVRGRLVAPQHTGRLPFEEQRRSVRVTRIGALTRFDVGDVVGRPAEECSDGGSIDHVIRRGDHIVGAGG